MPGSKPTGLPTAESLLARTVPGDGGCRVWTGARTAHGYPSAGRRIGGQRVRIQPGRIVLADALGRPLLDGECVLHRCDNPPCLAPEHLFPGTMQENSRDMMRKGRGRGQLLSGSANHNAKLTDADVRAIRAAYAAGGVTTTVLGARYGVHSSAVSRIVNRRQYADVM